MEAVKELASAIAELKGSEEVKRLVNEALSAGTPVEKVLEEGVRVGLEAVGRKYEAGEYFLAELLYAASLVNDAITILKPRLSQAPGRKAGKIILGTVRGDIHDIGKNVFKMLAEAAGFEVHDVGVDVAPGTFVRKLEETGANVLALSALLTTTLQEMRNVIEELKAAGVRGKVKVLLGGNAVTKEFAKEVGADGAALNAVEGVEMCKRWLGG